MGTTLSVTFSAGLTITSIGSATDTSIITIQQLPPNTDASAIHLLVSRFKSNLPSEAIRAMPIEGATYATAKFADMATALEAVKALDGTPYENHTLSVKLYQSKSLANVSQSATRVGCTFFSPSRIASICFATHRAAQQAVGACDGKRIRGRKVESKLKSRYGGKSSKGEISVGDLAAATTKADVKRVFRYGVTSVFLHEPTYDLSTPEAMTYVTSLFTQQSSDVEGWDIVSPPDAYKTKAIIRFKTAAAALDAVRSYDGSTCDFLGGCKIFLQPIYTANFKIAPEIHRAVAKELSSLTKEQPPGVQIRVFGGGAHTLATVRITGQVREEVSKAKAMVGKLVRGRIFQTANGEVIWDSFWATAEGILKITEIGHETKTFVFCDKRKSQLFLFGAMENQEKAVEQLHESMASIAEKVHEISLEGATWKRIMRGGLRALQEKFGIKVNAVKRCIVFTGSAAELEEVRTSLRYIGENEVTTPAADGDCPICFDTAENPTQFSSCGHVYCLSCLRDYAKSTLETRKIPITCISEECDHCVDLPVLATILSPPEFETILSTAFTDHIRRHPDTYSYCPTPNCATVYRTSSSSNGNVISCADCLLSICTSCAVEAHDGLTCFEYKLSKHSDEKADLAFERWKKRNGVHACPTCGTDIQKVDGCDHITCQSCKAHICWKCLKVFAEGGMVYEHMNREHGGIGVGLDDDW